MKFNCRIIFGRLRLCNSAWSSLAALWEHAHRDGERSGCWFVGCCCLVWLVKRGVEKTRSFAYYVWKYDKHVVSVYCFLHLQVFTQARYKMREFNAQLLQCVWDMRNLCWYVIFIRRKRYFLALMQNLKKLLDAQNIRWILYFRITATNSYVAISRLFKIEGFPTT